MKTRSVPVLVLLLAFEPGCVKLPTESNTPPAPPALSVLSSINSYALGCVVLITGTDGDNDLMAYQFEASSSSGTAGTVSKWSNYFPSGQQVLFLIQAEEGSYDLRVRSRDAMNDISTFSNTVQITFANISPYSPEAPTGDTSFFAGSTGRFRTRASDPEGDVICFRFDPGNGEPCSPWSSWQNPNSEYEFSHMYPTAGTFGLKVQCKDDRGNISGWSEDLVIHVRSNLILTGTCLVPGQADKLIINENFAYISSLGGGLQIADVSDPTLPRIVGGVGSYSSTRIARNAYAAFLLQAVAWYGTFHSFDVSVPSAPTHLDSIDVPCARDFDVEGNLAAVCTFVFSHYSSTNLTLLDVTNPASPAVISRTTLFNMTDGTMVRLRLPYALVNVPSALTATLYILDLSNLASPAIRGQLSLPTSLLEELPLSLGPDSYAYVAAGGFLNVIDYSNPSNPVLVTRVAIEQEYYDMSCRGGYLAVAEGSHGVQLFDVTIPDSPVLTGDIETDGVCKGVYCGTSHLFVADGSGGLLVFNYPRREVHYDKKTQAQDNRVFFDNGSIRISLLQADDYL